MTDNWEKETFGKHPGALKRQLGYPVNKPLPPGVIPGIVVTPTGNKFRGKTVTPLMKKRAIVANNASKRG